MTRSRFLPALAALAIVLSAAAARANWTDNGVDLMGNSHNSGPFYSAPDDIGGVFTWMRVYAGGISGVHRVFRVTPLGNVVEMNPLTEPTTGFAPDGNGNFYRACQRPVSGQLSNVYLRRTLANCDDDASWPGTAHEVGVAVSTSNEQSPGLAGDG